MNLHQKLVECCIIVDSSLRHISFISLIWSPYLYSWAYSRSQYVSKKNLQIRFWLLKIKLPKQSYTCALALHTNPTERDGERSRERGREIRRHIRVEYYWSVAWFAFPGRADARVCPVKDSRSLAWSTLRRALVVRTTFRAHHRAPATRTHGAYVHTDREYISTQPE